VSASTDPGTSFSCSIDDDWTWLEVYADCDCDGSDEPSPPDRIKIIGRDFMLFPGVEPTTLLILDSCISSKQSTSFVAPDCGTDNIPIAICSVQE
jgi:hypothetical protein